MRPVNTRWLSENSPVSFCNQLQRQVPRSQPAWHCQTTTQKDTRTTALPAVLADRAEPSSRLCLCHDYYDQLIPYEEGWNLQKELVEQVINSAQSGKDGFDAVILLQHPPVYTLGAGSTLDNLRFDARRPPLPLHRTERGGEVTYHGPGQLVLYPILNLRAHRQDLHWYLRSLEEVAIRALAEVSGLQGEQEEGLTGVWVRGIKVAAIGVRARKWVTYHGLAINVSTNLAPYEAIIPCGIADRQVGSVKQLLEQEAWAEDPFVVPNIEEQQLLLEYRHALLDAFSEVFSLQLHPAATHPLLQMA